MMMKPIFYYPLVFFLCFGVVSCIVQANEGVEKFFQQGQYYQLDLPQVVGPETVAFDCNGKGPYVSVSDGRILRWDADQRVWTEFAITSPIRDRNLCDGSTDPYKEPMCGRPLGLKFNPATCDLYIADAYFGLQMVGPNGGQAQILATSADGMPFRFTNGLDIDAQTGAVYFTDSSFIFQRRQWLMVTYTGERSGRLMKYDPNTRQVNVLLRGLAFPNGVALSKDNSFLLVAETTTKRVIKFWLAGPRAYTPQLFAQLEGSPDNIKRNDEGEFWVALGSGWPIKMNEAGNIIQTLELGQKVQSVSDVEQHNGFLFLGSVGNAFVAILRL